MTNQDIASTTATAEETLSMAELAQTLGAELKLGSAQIARTVALLDEGNTIPFIARYRKEVTGSLDEVQIQAIADRAGALRALFERKADVRRLIDGQGKLTPELAAAIAAASTLQEVEDLYLPYRPKRKTRASVAREKGLAPLADLILQQPELRGDIDALLEEQARPFLDPDKGVETSLEAYAGAPFSNAPPSQPKSPMPKKLPKRIPTASTGSTTISTKASVNLSPTACWPSTAPSTRTYCVSASPFPTNRPSAISHNTTPSELLHLLPDTSPTPWKMAISACWLPLWNAKCA